MAGRKLTSSDPGVKNARDEFSIVGPAGRRISPYPLAPIALKYAQDAAMDAASPLELIVERRPLVGSRPPQPIYRVIRDEDGSVLTYTLSRED